MRGFRNTTAASPQISDIYVRGPVDTPTIVYAQRAVAGAVATGPPPRHLKIKIAEYSGRGQAPLCVVQVTTSVPRALQRLGARLAHGAGPPTFSGDEWQHRRTPRIIPTYARPRRQPRGLVRHKAFPLAIQNAATAALTMDLRDYDFHLLINDHDRQDSVVHRGRQTGYHLSTVSIQASPGRDHSAWSLEPGSHQAAYQNDRCRAVMQ
ncbi:sigma 54 modulation/S30EA ribosomal C-terminal domain-containing protein [Paractinoplanes hotanensis]|uniref:sigma 54 modulation/S30EA ribosomal C-terminal domain-containing protein n=1 Tax=Paractinoplanes hotanensis TaxID=2906497 RepID=UPI0034DAD882